MSKRIAPTLQAFIPRLTPLNNEEKATYAKLWLEMRLLLAVARAASPGHPAGHGTTNKRGECRLCIALARLDRVSKEGGS